MRHLPNREYLWKYIAYYSEQYRDATDIAMKEFALKQLNNFCDVLMQDAYNG